MGQSGETLSTQASVEALSNLLTSHIDNAESANDRYARLYETMTDHAEEFAKVMTERGARDDAVYGCDEQYGWYIRDEKRYGDRGNRLDMGKTEYEKSRCPDFRINRISLAVLRSGKLAVTEFRSYEDGIGTVMQGAYEPLDPRLIINPSIAETQGGTQSVLLEWTEDLAKASYEYTRKAR